MKASDGTPEPIPSSLDRNNMSAEDRIAIAIAAGIARHKVVTIAVYDDVRFAELKRELHRQLGGSTGERPGQVHCIVVDARSYDHEDEFYASMRVELAGQGFPVVPDTPLKGEALLFNGDVDGRRWCVELLRVTKGAF
jgi:hypothetical protein